MAATSTSHISLDLSNFPKLSALGDNYSEWRSSWAIAFRYAGVWDVVSSGKVPPTCRLPDWRAREHKAMFMLIGAVGPELVGLVASYEYSTTAWTRLKERFDRKLSTSTGDLLKTITSMRYRDGDNLQQHIDHFHRQWRDMQKRHYTSLLWTSDATKGLFFLATLPGTMDHVVDHITTNEITGFANIVANLPERDDDEISQTVMTPSDNGTDEEETPRNDDSEYLPSYSRESHQVE